MGAWLVLAAALPLAGVLQDASTMDALARGRELKWQMRSQTSFRREGVRMSAVRAFRVGASALGGEGDRAQCAFRTGELLRAAGLREAALAEFSWSTELGGAPWSQRGALAAGELLIALGRPSEAVRVLERISGREIPTRFREAARVLCGLSQREMGLRDSAMETWRAVAVDGLTPRSRLDAFVCWGRLLLDEGDLEGAAGVLHLCRTSLNERVRESTEQGRELRALLRCSPLVTAIRREVLRREAWD